MFEIVDVHFGAQAILNVADGIVSIFACWWYASLLGKTLPRAILLKLVDINFRTGSFEKLEKHGSGKIAEMPGKIAEMPGKIAEKKNICFR